MKKQDIALVLIGIVAYKALFGGSGPGNNSTRYYQLPNGQVVPESQLPSLGYINFQGAWVRPEQLNQITNQGMSYQDWQRLISGTVDWAQNAYALYEQIRDALNANSVNNAILDNYDPWANNPYDGPGGGYGWG